MARKFLVIVIVAILGIVPLHLHAQGRGQGPGNRGAAPAPAPRGGALFDITGYGVSLVTDDWRYRMLTPPKGNVDYLPVNAEGRRVTGRGMRRRTRRPVSSAKATARRA